MPKLNCLQLAKKLIIFPLGLVLFLLISQKSPALADSTNTINLQGKIVRNDTGYEGLNVTAGSPACVVSGNSNDTCDFRVRYYDASSSGNLLLTEGFVNKEIGQYNGAFNLSLGTGSVTAGTYSTLDAMIFAEDDVYVEIGFDPAGGSSYSEIFTRMPLQATAYAIRAKYASAANTAFRFDNAANSSGYTSPLAGMVYFDTTDSNLKVYDGTSWVDIGSGSGSSLWTDSGTYSFLTGTTDSLVLGSDTYTAIGSSTLSTYMASLGTYVPFAYDMGAERLTVAGDTLRSGLTVYSDYSSTGAWPLVTFKAEDSGFDNVVLEVIQDGVGALASFKKGSTEVFTFENEMTFFVRPRTTDPTQYENRLYNVNGVLYWNGTALGSGGSSSLWTDDGTYSYLTSTTDDLVLGGSTPGTSAFFFDVSTGRLGIGTSSPSSSLDIAGSNSQISNSTGDITLVASDSLVIKGNNLSNLTEWTNASGTILSLINQNGYASFGRSTSNSTAIVSIGANTGTLAQLNLASSGLDVSSAASGDLWWNGNNLYFYDGSNMVDLLVGGEGSGAGLFSENGSVANNGYLNVQHNADTYSVLADGWVCVGGSDNESCSGGNWKSIKEQGETIRHALKGDWEDADEDGIIRTSIGDASVSIDPSLNPGTGADGDAAVVYNTNINTTSLSVGRACADGGDAVNYNITAFPSSTTATLSSAPSVGCLSSGDEVLIINLQGTYTAMDNTGNYETLEVDNVSGSTITFKSAKKNYYGNGLTDDTNLGTTANTQRVMLQRVPNYKNLTVKSGINFYPSSWNGVKGGVIFFRASESANINGEINVSGLGYRGGVQATITSSGSSGGEAFCGLGGTGGTSGAGTSGAGGGGSYTGYTGGNGYCGGGGGQNGLGSENRGGAGGGAEYAGAGGGAGYGTAGGGGFSVSGQAESGGENTSGDGQTSAATYSAGGGGGTYGGPTLSKLFFGSAGAGGTMTTSSGAGPGGNGGGIIAISSSSLTISGSLKSQGVNGASASSGSGTGAGGGAGGSILLEGQKVNSGSSFVDVTGGTGGTGLGTSTWTSAVGGAGGHGRIAVYYADSYSGTTKNPTVTNYYDAGYNTYGMYVSPLIATLNAQTYDYIRWSQNLNTYGKVAIQTRSGNSTNPLDGTWEEWRPFTSTTNYLMIQSSDTHTQWGGTNATVSEGDTTRNVNFFEDEDEATATNITKVVSSTNGGYAETTIATADLTNYDYLTAWVRASQVGNTLRLGMGESAGSEQYEDITVDTSDTWQKVYWDLSDIVSSSKDGITRIRLTNKTSSSNTIYIDNVRAEKLNTSNDGSEISSTPNNYLQYRAIFTTTNLAYKPILRNVNISYNSGYQIVVYDNNNVRLYNNTGSTKYLKLDVATASSSTSGNGFVAGVAVSTVANGDGAVAFTFNTAEVYNNPTSKLFSVMNNSVEKMYLDAQGNLYVSGSIISGAGIGNVLTNNSGASVTEKTLVAVDPTMSNAFKTTTVPNQMGAFGVVTGVSVNSDVNSNGVCDDGDGCMVVFEGMTDVLTVSASSASVGDYVYTSTTAGQAKRSAEQENGMIGVVTSIENAASGHLKVVFNSQNKVAADLYLNVGFDKNAYRDMYTLLAEDYESKSLAERRGVLENDQSESVMFDTFVDTLKMNSGTSDVGLDTYNQKMGLWGGLSIDGSTTDMAGNRYFGSSTATLLKSFYYDRTQSGEQGQDSTPETLVDLGIDPSWYNGVSLQTTNHLSTSYNGNLIAVTGVYGTGSEHGALDITVTGSSVTGLTANIVSTDGSCSVIGAALTFNTDYEFRAGSCSGSTININVKRAEFNSGDKFRVASWLVEPETLNDRGEVRVFPEKSLIIASRDSSNGYLTIVDADTQLVWMKFTQSSTGEVFGVSSNSSMSSIAMINGELSVGMNGSSATGMYSIQFNTEKSFKYSTTGKSISNKVLSDRNIANTYSLTSASEALVSNIVNDVSSNVIWNKPTQETTITGWGYIAGAATTALGELVNLPYTFNSAPNVSITFAGTSTTLPNNLDSCFGGGGYTSAKTYNVNSDTRTFRATILSEDGTNLDVAYYCYSWIATGSVSPKQVTAVAQGATGADGGVSVIYKNDSTVANVSIGSQTTATLWFNRTAIAGNSLYFSSNWSEDNRTVLYAYYGLHNLSTETSYVQNRSGYYYVGTQVSGWGLNGPTILGSSTGTNQITSLSVTPSTSTVEGTSNTIYVGTAQGVSVIQEKQSGNATLADGFDEKNGSVKYYTKDYISEQMVGDVRGMWSLNGTSSDASIKADTLTNNGSATYGTGVRGQSIVLNGTNQYLSCTDASCGGTSKTDTGSGSWSFGAWIKTTATTRQTIISKGASGSYSYELDVTADGSILNDRLQASGAGYISAPYAGDVNDGQWHYIVSSYTVGTKLETYIDGQLVASSTTIGGADNTNSTAPFEIGRRADGSFYFNGSIDEPFVTANALSASQIQSMYESGLKSLNGSHSSGDTSNQLNGSSNDIRDILITPDSRYMYVGTEGGGISKIDLTSDTRVDAYTTTSDPTTTTNNIESLSGRNYPVFAGDIGSTGSILGIDSNGNDATATYYSNQVTFVTPSNKAYMWLQAYIDPDDTNANITVSASNDGGATYVEGNPLRTVGTGHVEYEYSFDFASSDNKYIVKIEMERDSSKKSTIYADQWGLAQMDVTSGSGNSIYSQSQEGVVNGGYIEVVHGQNTYNILATGWVYDADLARWVKTADSSISITQNKNTDWLKDAEVSTTAGTSGDVNLGDGADGDVVLVTHTNINRTPLITGRSCADGGDAVNYNILSFNSAGTEATLNRPVSDGCLAEGDEVLIINLAGTNSAMDNVGNYETLIFDHKSGSTVYFKTAKTKYYGNNLNDDSNLGVAEGTQRVMLQRVPNYHNITVPAGLNFYPDEWATESAENATYRVSKGGVMFFRASGDVNVNGTIHATGKGYQGGNNAGLASYGGGQGGEAYCGIGGIGASTGTASNGAAGGGAYTGIAGSGYCGAGGGGATAGTGSVNRGGSGGGGGVYAGGGGGGYGTPGNGGSYGTANYGSNGGTNSSGNGSALYNGGGGGGGTYNDSYLNKLMFGSGGGKGGNYTTTNGGNGGDGGGIILIAASNITVSGNLTNNGVTGSNGTGTYSGGGGGGAGGSVRLEGENVNIGASPKLTVTAGSGGTGMSNSSVVVSGGTGGSGRVSVFYSETFSGTSGTPSVTNTYELDASSTPDVETILPDGIIRTAIGLADISLDSSLNIGNGSDGDITISSIGSSSININRTSSIIGRNCADGGDAVNYNILSFNSAGTEATLNRPVSDGCLAEGDEVLIINLAGTNSAMDNVGNYETLIFDHKSGSTVYFKTAKTKYYGNNLNDDSNIGLYGGNQIVMLQRVPNYHNVTVSNGGSFYPDDWATELTEVPDYRGFKGGVMFFRASGDVNVNGTIHATGKGYRGGMYSGGATYGGGQGGEAYCGLGGNGELASATGKSGASGGGAYLGVAGNGYCGGGGGAYAPGTGSVNRGGSGGGGAYYNSGGGGGYGTPGLGGNYYGSARYGQDGGQNSSGNGYGDGTQGGGGGGGGSYNDESLDKLMFGSGGGRGGNYNADSAGVGGDGGGVVYISANTITVSGNLTNSGANGGSYTGSTYAGGGGGGAGGSIRLEGATVNIGASKLIAAGGIGGVGVSNGNTYTNSGAGGNGRVALYYSETYSGTSGTPGVTNTYQGGSYTYGMYHSNVIPTIGASSYSDLRWDFENNDYGQMAIQTRTGASDDPTDGTWEEWKPAGSEAATLSLNNSDDAASWVGTNSTVSDGDATRNIDFFEDEDESTTGNITKLESSTNGGYAESTITSKNLSTYDYITAWVKSSVTGQSLSLGMGESVSNEQTEKVYIDSVEWQKVYWDITDIASADRDAITKLRITNTSSTPNTFYIDNVKAEKLPTSGLDSIHSTADDYLQYRIVFTTTDIRFKPQFSSISFTYNIGYEIVQIDSNTVRMYNYSGSTKKLRLDIVTGSLIFDLSQGSTTGTVNIAPQMAQIDDSGMNSIWINKTIDGGNLLKLQTLGVDAFVVNSDGDTTMAGDIQVQGGSIQLGSTGWIRFNDGTDELEFTNDGTDWMALGPRFTNTILSAEYAGAVFSADGSNNTGNMTADNEGASANSMNYYEWNSSESTLNDYDIRIRFTLPSNFDGWGTGGGVRFNFATEATGTTNNQSDFYVYKEDSATVDGSSEDQASASAGVWTSSFISGSSLDECSSAGDVCVLVVKMSSANDNYVRVGDIEIGYDRKL